MILLPTDKYIRINKRCQPIGGKLTIDQVMDDIRVINSPTQLPTRCGITIPVLAVEQRGIMIPNGTIKGNTFHIDFNDTNRLPIDNTNFKNWRESWKKGTLPRQIETSSQTPSAQNRVESEEALNEEITRLDLYHDEAIKQHDWLMAEMIRDLITTKSMQLLKLKEAMANAKFEETLKTIKTNSTKIPQREGYIKALEADVARLYSQYDEANARHDWGEADRLDLEISAKMKEMHNASIKSATETYNETFKKKIHEIAEQGLKLTLAESQAAAKARSNAARSYEFRKATRAKRKRPLPPISEESSDIELFTGNRPDSPRKGGKTRRIKFVSLL